MLQLLQQPLDLKDKARSSVIRYLWVLRSLYITAKRICALPTIPSMICWINWRICKRNSCRGQQPDCHNRIMRSTNWSPLSRTITVNSFCTRMIHLNYPRTYVRYLAYKPITLYLLKSLKCVSYIRNFIVLFSISSISISLSCWIGSRSEDLLSTSFRCQL